jgi:long-chain acyl-CoA synthetase
VTPNRPFSIADVLPRASSYYPNRLAVWDGDTRLTYGEVARRVAALTAGLAELGLQRGDRVAILDVNSFRYLEAYYAAAHGGFALVPLNSRLSAPETEYILNDSGARVLLVAQAFFPIVKAIQPKLASVEAIVAYGPGPYPNDFQKYERLIATSEAAPQAAVTPDDISQIYYTSGTTGQPKGVCLTYANMTASMFDSAVGLALTYDDVWMHAAPMFHLVDAWSIWAMPLLGGAQVPMHFDPELFMKTAERTSTTAVALPPTLINMVINHPNVPDFDLSKLRMIMFGGSPAPLGLLQKAADILPTAYIHAYGITETSGIVTLLRPESIASRRGAAGHPVAHIRAAIIDDHGNAVPANKVGEVVIGGQRVMQGYWNNADATREALRDGRYHTGDMGYFDDENNLYIVDRKKDMIITGGENVYSVEVESVISTHPAVFEVAVVGVPDERWGEAVKGIVVLRPNARASEEELITFCRHKIAGYKIPKSIEFSTEALPKTGPGKIAKRQLRDRYWQGCVVKI